MMSDVSSDAFFFLNQLGRTTCCSHHYQTKNNKGPRYLGLETMPNPSDLGLKTVLDPSCLGLTWLPDPSAMSLKPSQIQTTKVWQPAQ
jgi:hypothetical protein